MVVHSHVAQEGDNNINTTSAYGMPKTLRQECYFVINLDCDVTALSSLIYNITAALQHHQINNQTRVST